MSSIQSAEVLPNMTGSKSNQVQAPAKTEEQLTLDCIQKLYDAHPNFLLSKSGMIVNKSFPFVLSPEKSKFSLPQATPDLTNYASEYIDLAEVYAPPILSQPLKKAGLCLKALMSSLPEAGVRNLASDIIGSNLPRLISIYQHMRKYLLEPVDSTNILKTNMVRERKWFAKAMAYGPLKPLTQEQTSATIALLSEEEEGEEEEEEAIRPEIHPAPEAFCDPLLIRDGLRCVVSGCTTVNLQDDHSTSCPILLVTHTVNSLRSTHILPRSLADTPSADVRARRWDTLVYCFPSLPTVMSSLDEINRVDNGLTLSDTIHFAYSRMFCGFRSLGDTENQYQYLSFPGASDDVKVISSSAIPIVRFNSLPGYPAPNPVLMDIHYRLCFYFDKNPRKEFAKKKQKLFLIPCYSGDAIYEASESPLLDYNSADESSSEDEEYYTLDDSLSEDEKYCTLDETRASHRFCRKYSNDWGLDRYGRSDIALLFRGSLFTEPPSFLHAPCHTGIYYGPDSTVKSNSSASTRLEGSKIH